MSIDVLRPTRPSEDPRQTPDEGVTASFVTRLVRINFLAPDIVASLLSGRHDPDLSARKLMADTRFPPDWTKQRHALGFA